MGILIYEHFLGHQYNKEISPMILNEAKIITSSIAKDLSSSSKKQDVSVLINAKNSSFLKNTKLINRNYSKNLTEDIYSNLNKNDNVLVIAPEENLEMHNIVAKLEEKNVDLYNCNSNFIKITTNKKKINSYLTKSKNYLIETFDDYKSIQDNKEIIAKTFDGFGSEELYIFKNIEHLKNSKYLLTNRHIYQPYYKGNIIGINIIANDNNHKILSINEQIYLEKSNNTIALQTINIGKFNALHKLFDEFVNNILSNFEGFHGFFGIDAIMTNDKKILFLEINPRLTTSYSGLSYSLGFNPLELFYNINYDFSIEDNKNFLIDITNDK